MPNLKDIELANQAIKSPAQVLGNIRLPHGVVDNLINETVETLGEGKDTIASRLATDLNFQMRVSSLAHNILVSATLAQTMNADAPFSEMLDGLSFSAGDETLMAIGQTMVYKIAALHRLHDASLSDALLKSRFNNVFQAV
jgi:hypothetical protein